MSFIRTDAKLDKITFTKNALDKMKKWGLYEYYITDTLKHGKFCRPIIQNNRETIRQMYYRVNGKEVNVLFTRRDVGGKPIGGILVMSCWARNVK